MSSALQCSPPSVLGRLQTGKGMLPDNPSLAILEEILGQMLQKSLNAGRKKVQMSIKSHKTNQIMGEIIELYLLPEG